MRNLASLSQAEKGAMREEQQDCLARFMLKRDRREINAWLKRLGLKEREMRDRLNRVKG